MFLLLFEFCKKMVNIHPLNPHIDNPIDIIRQNSVNLQVIIHPCISATYQNFDVQI